MGGDSVLGGETTCLLDLPSAGSRPSSVFIRPFDEGSDQFSAVQDQGLGAQEGEE